MLPDISRISSSRMTLGLLPVLAPVDGLVSATVSVEAKRHIFMLGGNGKILQLL